MTSLADRAIAWYDTAARDLPWRRPGTSPWGVLVSEVMLQQTQVARVTLIWDEWLARWPEPADLAAAGPGEAIRAWGRLGYPRRALRLHACADALVARHDGRVPAELGDLLALPGIGAYTARAVAAFAFGQRHPVVDTNVRRLVARAATGRPDGGPATTTADLTTVAALLPLAPARAARASVALMELGALVCTARSPSCGRCPLRRTCRWHAGPPADAADATASRARPATAAGHASGGPPHPHRRPRVATQTDGTWPSGRSPTAANPADAAAVRRDGRRRPGYAGTDRHVRGLLLGVVRAAPAAVDRAELDAVWADPAQRDRALASLLADGLMVRLGPGRFGLP